MKLTDLKSLSFKSLSLPFNLGRRDKLALSVAAAVLALFIILQLIIFPVIDRRARLRDLLESKKSGLLELQTLAAEYEALSQNARGNEDQLKQRPKGFTLFSFLDALAGKSGIKQNIIYMKPSTTNLKNSPYTLSTVEMKIQSLTMEQLVNFLHGVEIASEMIYIKRMSIAKDDNKGQNLITAVMQVETYQL